MLTIVSPDHRHVAFLLSSWMKSMRLSPEYASMTDDDYYTWAREHVAHYIAHSDCRAILADGEIIGYVVYDGPILHWAYVRKDWRSKGVYQECKPEGLIAYSHVSPKWNHKRGGLLARPWFCGVYDV